jgi:hypothetical protein
MKTTGIIISMLLFVSSLAYSQTQEQTDHKKERKAEKQKEREWMAQVTKTMIDDHQFVLEADYLHSQMGDLIPVSSMVNFIMIDTTKATIQIGSWSGTGFGGTGTLTIDGNVTQYKVTKTEKKWFNAYNLNIIVFSPVGTYYINMYVTDDGQADATISSNTAGQLTYTGKIFPMSVSRVYKGLPRY